MTEAQANVIFSSLKAIIHQIQHGMHGTMRHDTRRDTTKNRNFSVWIYRVVGHGSMSCRTVRNR